MIKFWIHLATPKADRRPLRTPSKVGIWLIPSKPAEEWMAGHGYVPHIPTPPPEVEDGKIAVRTGYDDEGKDVWEVRDKPPPPVPERIEKRQLVIGLIAYKEFADEAAVDDAVVGSLKNIQDPKTQAMARANWRHAAVIPIGHPLTLHLQADWAWTDEELQDFFRGADKIK